jgi:hypothetical protein
VRKNKTNESNIASFADSNPLWTSVLRDILIPRLAEANGDASAPFDTETFRALLAPAAPEPDATPALAAAEDDGSVGADVAIVATVFAGAAQPAALTSVQAFDWLHTRFGADIYQGGVSGQSHIALSEHGVGTAVGGVSMASLGADIAALAQNALVNFGDRAIIGADEGDLAGGMFLVIDANGQAGFQYGEDEILVIFNGLPSTDLSVDLPPI